MTVLTRWGLASFPLWPRALTQREEAAWTWSGDEGARQALGYHPRACLLVQASRPLSLLMPGDSWGGAGGGAGLALARRPVPALELEPRAAVFKGDGLEGAGKGFHALCGPCNGSMAFGELPGRHVCVRARALWGRPVCGGAPVVWGPERSWAQLWLMIKTKPGIDSTQTNSNGRLCGSELANRVGAWPGGACAVGGIVLSLRGRPAPSAGVSLQPCSESRASLGVRRPQLPPSPCSRELW